MPADKFARPPAVGIDPEDDLRIGCYIRSTVAGPVADTIDTVVDRLQRLKDRGCIADYRVFPWPPERSSGAETNATAASTRHDLVATFERWADRHGHSLEPGFRRREDPSSPFGVTVAPRERVHVPIVALALYEDDGDEPRPAGDAESLRGVIPYTESPETDAQRTCTVTDWLTAVAPEDENSPASAQQNEAARLEGL